MKTLKPGDDEPTELEDKKYQMDMRQPYETTKGYFIGCEKMKDFVDYLFDVENIGDYNELYEKFLQWEEKNTPPHSLK